MAATTGDGRSMRRERSAEAVAGYALIAVPMILFLVLNIGSIFYAFFISLWKWNVRSGPVEFRGKALPVEVFAVPCGAPAADTA